MTDLAGKRVLITGGASGIGRRLAQKMAAIGANIVIWDIDNDGMEALKPELEQTGVEVNIFQCDLTDRDAIATVANQMRELDCHVDVLVNNAGIVSGGHLLEISDSQIERTFAVNTMALFWLTRAFLPDMINNGSGHVVTIASAAGLTGTAKQVDYSASKFAAVGFDEALRVELRNIGTPVQTTVICPFYISTDMFSGVRTRFPRLLPILTPEYAVNRIIGAIKKNKRRVIMPRLVYSVFFMRLMPVALMDATMRFFGVNESMANFVGHSDQSS